MEARVLCDKGEGGKICGSTTTAAAVAFAFASPRADYRSRALRACGAFREVAEAAHTAPAGAAAAAALAGVWATPRGAIAKRRGATATTRRGQTRACIIIITASMLAIQVVIIIFFLCNHTSNNKYIIDEV